MLGSLEFGGVPDHGTEVTDLHLAARFARAEGDAAADDDQGEHLLIQPETGDGPPVVRRRLPSAAKAPGNVPSYG
ncbi:MAG TPA: hypothetical protein VFR56_03550, partial [Actinomycetes bacterium]|nr:hypothetical protein [Actinomycetes bacterium]